jgi:hypothetical protein
LRELFSGNFTEIYTKEIASKCWSKIEDKNTFLNNAYELIESPENQANFSQNLQALARLCYEDKETLHHILGHFFSTTNVNNVKADEIDGKIQMLNMLVDAFATSFDNDMVTEFRTALANLVDAIALNIPNIEQNESFFSMLENLDKLCDKCKTNDIRLGQRPFSNPTTAALEKM